MSLKKLVGLRSQNQFIGDGLVYGGIPLLLIVTAQYIYVLSDPPDSLDAIIQIVDFRIAYFIHKLLNILHLGKIHIAVVLKMWIHGIRNRSGIIKRKQMLFQHLEDLHHGFLPLILHFVSDAPYEYAWMVSVSSYHTF
ncbi:hypothetical protein D3C81_1392420 [compost metagenome]